MSAKILSLHNFGVAFRDRTVLRGVDLDIDAHGVSLIVGPVAVGKSTLLRAIAGLLTLRPETRMWGEAIFAGRPLDDTPVEERPALVAQKTQLMTASVLENLVCHHPYRSQMTWSDQRALAAAMVHEAGLPELADRLDQPVVELPIGWQRRLAIVRTTAARPALLCVDEPTAELPPAEAQAILTLLAKYAEHAAVLMVTHNQAHAQTLGGKTSLLVSGRVIEHGPTDRFFNQPKTAAARQFVRTGGCGDLAIDEWELADENAAAEQVAEAIDSAEQETPAVETAAVEAAAVETATANLASANANVGTSTITAEPVVAGPSVVRKKRTPQGLGPRGFVWLWPERLGGAPRPGLLRETERDLELLANLGVTALVCLTDEAPPVAEDLLRRYELIGLWAPVADMGAPDLEQGWRLAVRIAELLDQGHSVAVHCRAGLGRTGTVLAAQLIYQEGRSALEALETVRRSETRWVQSPAQVDFLVKFAAFVEKRKREAVAMSRGETSQITPARPSGGGSGAHPTREPA